MKYVLIAIAIIISGFFITDCSTGKWSHDEATVAGRYYKPPYTTTSLSCDDEGCTVDVDEHPEEWHTTVKVESTGNILDFNAGKQLYFSLTNGQFVTIKSRQGKWTGIKYLGTIEP